MDAWTKRGVWYIHIANKEYVIQLYGLVQIPLDTFFTFYTALLYIFYGKYYIIQKECTKTHIGNDII